MKKLFKINKWLVIITLVLYLTFYLGALFQIVLGTIQIVMSLFIITKFNQLSKELKILFIIYCFAACAILFLLFTNYVNHELWIILFLIIPMLISLFHLYITFKISKS